MTQQQIKPQSERLLTLDMVSEMTGYSPAEIALIARTVAIGAPLQELAAFLYACRETGLKPLLRQAYWIRRGGKGSLQVGIDGFRSIADSSGAYAGSEAPIFRGEVKLKERTVPAQASVTVWRIVAGHKSAFHGLAFWNEFYPGDGPDGAMWRKMPHRMLGKAAEAEALRKGFPAQLSTVTMDAVAGEDEQLVVERTHKPPAPRRTIAEESALYERIYGEDEPERAPVQSPTLPEPELDADEAGLTEEAIAASAAEIAAQQELANEWRRNRELSSDAASMKIRVPVTRNNATLDQLIAANEHIARQIREAQP